MPTSVIPQCFVLALVLAGLGSGAAHAQDAATAAEPSSTAAPDQFDMPTSMGDAKSIEISANYGADLNADLAGGGRRGVAYLGRLGILFDAKPGWNDTSIHASLLTIHGTGLTGQFVGNLNTVSGLEAEPAARLNQLWVETALSRKTRLRIGKFPAAPNFATSNAASLFVNAAFGWPTAFALDLPQGGPAWPLAAPGVMVTSAPRSGLTLSGAVFAGLPAGVQSDDPQRDDAQGFGAFRLRGAPLAIGEAAFDLGRATMKAGGWYQSSQSGSPVAPANVGATWSAYALVDVQLMPARANARQLSAFARIFLVSPDRSASPFYADAGLVLKAPLPRRPDDQLGLAAGYVAVRDTGQYPTGDEFVSELSYQLQLSPRLSLQPNVQLIRQSRENPAFPGAERSALVPGVRINLHS